MLAPVEFEHAPSEARLLRVAVELGGIEAGGSLSPAEHLIVHRAMSAERPSSETLDAVRAAIQAGDDPLGDELCRLRPHLLRRSIGAFYTPPGLVQPMMEWVLEKGARRVVDAGCGSGRFAAAAALGNPGLEIVAVDLDPVATLLTRATLAVLGARHTLVLHCSYTTLKLPPAEGRTAFVGNPPYVRHHNLMPKDKAWAARAADALGCHVSGLAGLHVHFYLATALHARAGDIGCFVTSSEWMDVGYGATVRDLLVNGLGAQVLCVVDARAVPFDDAQATAVVACFEVGSAPKTVQLRLVHSISDVLRLDRGDPIPTETLASTGRWRPLLEPSDRPINGDRVVPLGSVARVHRGLVTGGNDFFLLTRERARELGLERWCRPAITAAQEILSAGGVLRDTPERKLLLDVPPDVDRSLFPTLDSYLKLGEMPRNGRPSVSEGYICRHRKPWWYLGRQKSPPMVASYMARQAPAFASNKDGLALVNIGHGLYPVKPLDWATIDRLVSELNSARDSFRGRGRTYQGGLEKFEHREMETLAIASFLRSAH